MAIVLTLIHISREIILVEFRCHILPYTYHDHLLLKLQLKWFPGECLIWTMVVRCNGLFQGLKNDSLNGLVSVNIAHGT